MVSPFNDPDPSGSNSQLAARPLAPRRALPVSFAFLWTLFITAALWFGLTLVFTAFGRRANDIVLLGITQVAVYALVIAAFGAVFRTPARELLALRPAALNVCLASVALGAALQIPATVLSDVVERFYPLPPGVLAERMARITPHSTAHGIAIFVVVAFLGPCVEELFFRGALFGALRRGQGALVTIAVVSLCFALGHLDPRLLLPLVMAAFVIGEVRECTGSLWPGLLLHAAFNSATLAVVFSGGAPAGKPPPVPPFLVVSGCALSVGLFVLVRTLALSSALAQKARQRDAH